MWQENEKEPNTHMEYVVFAFVAAGLVALLAAKGIYDSKSEKARILYRFRHKYGELRKKEYGLDRYKAIAGYFKHHGNEEQVDEITFQDLSMDDIFMQMNFTNCQAGEEVLYHLLRTPDFTEEPLAHKEAVIQYFEEHKEASFPSMIIWTTWIFWESAPTCIITHCLSVTFLPLHSAFSARLWVSCSFSV